MTHQAITTTVEAHRKNTRRVFWRAYGQFLFGSRAKIQRFLGLTILALALGKVLTANAYACAI